MPLLWLPLLLLLLLRRGIAEESDRSVTQTTRKIIYFKKESFEDLLLKVIKMLLYRPLHVEMLMIYRNEKKNDGRWTTRLEAVVSGQGTVAGLNSRTRYRRPGGSN